MSHIVGQTPARGNRTGGEGGEGGGDGRGKG